jgi:hypothetical protein
VPGEAARVALLGAGVPAAEAGQAARQPALLPAPRRRDDPQIRSLLYEQGFTIGGARQQLSGAAHKAEHKSEKTEESEEPAVDSGALRKLREELEAVVEILR